MNQWITADGAIAVGYAAHGRSLRGVIRHALVHQALMSQLESAPGPVRILDVGGGAATQAVMLAHAGHAVTVLDPDTEMLAQARSDLAGQDAEIRDRISLVAGRGEQAVDLVGGGWDVVCCHGVLMYVDDPRDLLGPIVAAAADGGLVSVVAKNAEAMPMRPALEGRWADALALVDGDRVEMGNLGVPSRGQTIDELVADLEASGARLTEWHGVRVATDHLGDIAPTSDTDYAIALEWELGRRDPYRRLARLLHLIATKPSHERNA
jgi:SAM-dependent methyltransferase